MNVIKNKKNIYGVDWDFYIKNGYYLIKEIFNKNFLKIIKSHFIEIYEQENGKCSQHQLLKNDVFLNLIEYPNILNPMKFIFGSQIQLLQYDLLYQPPQNNGPFRNWHRDLSFPGQFPLSTNCIIYLEDMDEDIGPTYVVPGTHIGWLPEIKIKQKNIKLTNEIAINAEAGDMAIINSSILHSGSINKSKNKHRRNIYIYYGYWWLKRYKSELKLPWQCFNKASEQRLQLLGIKSPENADLHIYEPDSEIIKFYN